MKSDFNFDEYADNYSETASDRVKITGGNAEYFAEYKIIELTKRLPSHKGTDTENILDVGCGVGLSAKYFIGYFKNANICGIDVSEKSIETAIKANYKNATFKAYNGTDFPFDDENFSIAFVSGVFHHVVSQKTRLSIISEIYRTLKKDGYLFIFEHNPANIFTRIITNNPEDKAGKLVPIKELKNLVSSKPFSEIELFNTLFFPRNKFLRWLLPLENVLYKIPFGGQYYVMAKK